MKASSTSQQSWTLAAVVRAGWLKRLVLCAACSVLRAGVFGFTLDMGEDDAVDV